MRKKSLLFQIVLYCLCSLLVILFVNLYIVFAIADRMLPASVIQVFPILLVAFLVAAVLVYYLRIQGNTLGVNRANLMVGGVLCICALFIPESHFPAKKIHVVEYMVLVCLVRYTMSWRLQGATLLFFSVVAAILFGIHDELLQGIHPSRTYGLRDMLVNSIAAIGGGLIWHGCSLFARTEVTSPKKGSHKNTIIVSAYFCWLFFSVVAFVIPLVAYRQETVPYWPLLPLSGAVVWWSLYFHEIEEQLNYGCAIVNCLAYLFLVYPVTINVSSYTFH